VFEKRRLFTPGPVEVPPQVLLAMAAPILHHRTAEFEALFTRCLDRLRPVFGTASPVMGLAASGSGAMEAVAVGLARRGETALVVEAGRFGERWSAILRAYGVPVTTLPVEWGQAPKPEALAAALAAHREARVVFLTHSETSTGVLMDLEALARVAREHGAMLAVDCITSAVAHSIRMDAWGVDAVVAGSQKGFMLPPGLAFVALSERARERVATTDLPRFYFDLAAAASSQAKRTTPFTPAVSLFVGLDAALGMLEAEGLENAIARHAALGAAARAGVQALGLEIFPARPSNVLTVFRTSPGTDGDLVRKDLERRFGVKIAGGQGRLKGQILRLGHLGYYDATDLFGALSALERVLIDAGQVRVAAGTAVGAASAVFATPTPAAVGGR
jgi:serine---pyruvate transaminase